MTGPLHREFGGPPMAATGAAASLSKLGHQVKLVVCGQSDQDIEANSQFFLKLRKYKTEVKILRRRKVSKYGTVLRIHELKSIWTDIRNVDIVILHQIFELQHLSLFPILILLKKPFAVMPHGTLTSYQRKQHRFRKFLTFPAIYLFLNSAISIFLATTEEKSQLPSFLVKKGLVVGLGIDIPEIETRNFVNSPSTFNLLFLGRIARKKRLDIALQAFALASKKSHLRMKFIVCGSGEELEMAQLKDLVVSLQIERDVEFRGWVDSNEKRLALQESDCFILTSEDENFAIAAAEALAHGVPCILSSNVALASLVIKHNAGIVFEDFSPIVIENAINLVSALDRETVRSSSLRAASELSWELIATQWENCIREIITN